MRKTFRYVILSAMSVLVAAAPMMASAATSYSSPVQLVGRPNTQTTMAVIGSVEYGNNVYVLDRATVPGTSMIKVYTRSDQFVQSFGKLGTGNGELLFPSALTVNQSTGVVSVLDMDMSTGASRVVEYTSTGTFIRAYAGPQPGNGQFESDKLGNIYIVTSSGAITQYNNGVQVAVIGDGSVPTEPTLTMSNLSSFTVDNQNNLLVAQKYDNAGVTRMEILKLSPTGALLDTYRNTTFNTATFQAGVPPLQIDIGPDGTLHTMGCNGISTTDYCYRSYKLGPAPGQVTPVTQALQASQNSQLATASFGVLNVGESGDIYLDMSIVFGTRRFDNTMKYQNTIGRQAVHLPSTLFTSSDCKTLNVVDNYQSVAWFKQFSAADGAPLQQQNGVYPVAALFMQPGPNGKFYAVGFESTTPVINEVRNDMTVVKKIATLSAIPSTLAVDKEGNFYYSIPQNGIYKLDSSGTQIRQFATTGTGTINQVIDLEVDSKGIVYALNSTQQGATSTSTIYKYDANGVYTGMLDSATSDMGNPSATTNAYFAAMSIGGNDKVLAIKNTQTLNATTGMLDTSSSLKVFSKEGVAETTIPFTQPIDGVLPVISGIASCHTTPCDEAIYLGDNASGRILKLTVSDPAISCAPPSLLKDSNAAIQKTVQNSTTTLAKTGLGTGLVIGMALMLAGASMAWMVRLKQRA